MGDIQDNYPECVAELHIFSHMFSYSCTNVCPNTILFFPQGH